MIIIVLALWSSISGQPVGSEEVIYSEPGSGCVTAEGSDVRVTLCPDMTYVAHRYAEIARR